MCNEPVNVKDFGATDDGFTDDADAITLAIERAGSARRPDEPEREKP